uniref:Peptidase M13 N-terminal domain-containing protein n=1 Tax=Glossina pallidipes TaxID=7398 RepID=A0A1A9ZG76_GLOPL
MRHQNVSANVGYSLRRHKLQTHSQRNMKTFRLSRFLILLTYATHLIAEEEEDVNRIYLNHIKANMNFSVDPCEDFYEYACGNWHRNYNSSYYYDAAGYMEHTVNKQLQEILNKAKNGDIIYNIANNAYEACTNLDTISVNPMLQLVQEDLQFIWPIFTQSATWCNDNEFDWLKTMAILRTYGLNGVFLTTHINVLFTDGSQRVLELQQHQLTMELLYYDVEEIFLNFGVNISQSQRIAKNVIDFQEELKNISFLEYVPENFTANITYQSNFRIMTIQELQESAPHIQWHKYFEIILNRIENINELQVQCFAFNPDYYENLKLLLVKTSTDTIVHYIMLRFIYHLHENLPLKRPQDCLRYLRSTIPLIMNVLYEEYIYESQRVETEQILKEMFEKLKINFEKMLQENSLQLNESEMKYILEELSGMALRLGNVPLNRSKEYLQRYYRDLYRTEINKTDFAGNHLKFLKFRHTKGFIKLDHFSLAGFYDYDPESIVSSSPVKLFDNIVLVPHGYLQMPFFHHKLTKHLQYSLLGFILAHEIIHAYDLYHIVYDHKGNYNHMGSQVTQHFLPYMDCKYGTKSWDNVTVSNDLLSENMADISGLRLAYQTYVEAIENEIFSTYSLNLTNEQLFFVNSVQFLCANMHEISALNLTIPERSHDMHDIRFLCKIEKYSDVVMSLVTI